MAGSIAYSAFISLFPLLVLAIIGASIVGGETFAQYIIQLTQTYLSPTGQELIVENLTKSTGRTEISVVTFLVFLWATMRVFRGLDVAFSILYDTGGEDDLLDQFRDGIIVLTALTVAVGGSIGIYLVLKSVPYLPYVRFFNYFTRILFLTIVFLPIYYLFPDTNLSVRQVVPGAVVAAFGWTTLQFVFQLYVSVSSKAELYGVIGAVILLITWLYFGALIILIGATVNVVLGRQLSTRQQTTETN